MTFFRLANYGKLYKDNDGFTADKSPRPFNNRQLRNAAVWLGLSLTHNHPHHQPNKMKESPLDICFLNGWFPITFSSSHNYVILISFSYDFYKNNLSIFKYFHFSKGIPIRKMREEVVSQSRPKSWAGNRSHCFVHDVSMIWCC